MDLLDGLVGHWPLDRKSYDQATHQFKDLSAKGNHGTGTGDNLGDTFDFERNQHDVDGGATPFDGSSDYVNCVNDTSLGITGAITLSVWAKCTDWTNLANTPIFDKFGSAANYSFLLWGLPGGELRMIIANDTGAALQLDETTTGMNMTTNTWYHIVCVWNKTTGNLKFYKNAALIETLGSGGTANLYNNSQGLKIGEDYDGVDKFIGCISDVRIYNRALSQDEITWLYLEQKKNAYETVTILKPLEKPIRISKERSLIVLKKEKDCGI